MWLFLTPLILVTLIWGAVFYWKNRRLYQLARQFKGPASLPLLGNAHQCLIPINDRIDALLKNATFFQSPIKFWFGTNLVLYFTTPSHAKTILTSPHCLAKLPYFYNVATHVIGRGLVTLPVDEWKIHRRIIGPNFNQNRMRQFFDIQNNHSKELVRHLNEETQNGYFDVIQCLTKTTMRMILESLLGINTDGEIAKAIYTLGELFNKVLFPLTERLSNLLYMSDFIFERSQAGKRFRESIKKYLAVLDSIIDKWKENLEKRQSGHSEGDAPSVYLMDTEQGLLSAEDLREEVHTILVAGLEATASMTGFLLIMLGMHPEVQDKVLREISKVDELTTFEDLNKFEYLDRVIKETLRLFPVLIAFARYTEKEIKLDEYTIPANTNVIVGSVNIHRDSEIWPEPTRFDPERFLPEEEAKRHPYSWIPFSAGPRNCIGFRYGLMALKVMAFHIIKNYKVGTTYKSVDEMRLSCFFVIRPVDGYNISVTRR